MATKLPMDPQSTCQALLRLEYRCTCQAHQVMIGAGRKARLNVLVGSIRHNILSITSLADSGWRFTQGPKGFDLFHEKLGMHCLDVAYFANCPWVRLYPDVGSSSAYRSDLTVSDTRDFSVAAVSGGDDSELARHRRQGHIPFNPNCLECAKGRSVFQHRRDKGDRKEVSIQADFAFLNTTGEIVADELPGSVKILVLTEMMSRCIGYVVVGEDVEAARRQIVVWLQHFGLTSKAVSIDVHTDSERAVERSLEIPLVDTRSLFAEPRHNNIDQLGRLSEQLGN